VEPGYGKIKFSGLLQAWYSSGNQGVRDSFRIRRAELKFTGDITPQIKWTLMIDPAKSLALNNTYTTVNGAKVVADTSVNQAGRILQEAFIAYDIRKDMRLSAGQFKLPLSMEGLQSSGALDTIERALFASDRGRGGSYGDIRDVGAMLSGTLAKQVDYQVGMFNGSGESQNDVDKNDQKAFIGRVVFRPAVIKGLQFGGSGAWGRGVRSENPRHDRLGAEIRYSRDKFTFKSEVMRGADADFNRIGYYVHVGYKINPRLESIFRVDSWDPDRRHDSNASNVGERDYVMGLNYLMADNHAKFQLNYVRKTFANGIVPSRNLVLLGLQTSW
jgi:phosphate-selective porin OprO/OprP